MQRLEACAQSRAKSPTPAFRAAADTPMLFAEIRQPDTTYLVIPEVSSERRRYVPIGYIEPEIIAANTVYVLPNASIYMFGVMTSNVHMAWMRVVCSRMKSDYRYTPAVYNNFPWLPHLMPRKPRSSRPPRPSWTPCPLPGTCSLLRPLR